MQRNYPSAAKCCTSGECTCRFIKNQNTNEKRIQRRISTAEFGFYGLFVPVFTPYSRNGIGTLGALARKVLVRTRNCELGEPCMSERRPATERRKWSRLPLAIPVFVRSLDDKGNESLEFATALNVGAGGMLLGVRRAVKPGAALRIEIPSAPVANMTGDSVARTLEGRVLRIAPAEGYYLLGIKFLRPLTLSSRASRKRKLVSSL